MFSMAIRSIPTIALIFIAIILIFTIVSWVYSPMAMAIITYAAIRLPICTFSTIDSIRLTIFSCIIRLGQQSTIVKKQRLSFLYIEPTFVVHIFN